MNKVLLITDGSLDGGTNKYLYDVICELIDKVDYEFVLLIDDNPNMAKMINLCRNLGIEVFAKQIYHGYYDEKIIKTNVNEIIEEVKPLLVHFFSPSVRAGIAIRETVLENNIPMFSSEMYVPKHYPFTVNELHRLEEIYKRSNKIVTVSKSSANVLMNEYKLCVNNNEFIPTSIDVVNNSSKKEREFPIKVIVLGRLVKQKGVDILISAISSVHSKIKDRFVFYISGDGEEKEKLQKQVVEAKLENEVVFLGYSKNIKSTLSDYDLAIVPSRDEGGTPNVALELLNAGLPCVFSNSDGLVELSNNGEYALLFNMESINDLGKVLVDLSYNINLLDTINVGIEGYLKENYDIKKNYLKYKTMWDDVVKNHL